MMYTRCAVAGQQLARPRLLQITALWRPVLVVELLVAAVMLPLQYASLAVVTLPLTLPWIVGLLAAAPAAVAEGAQCVAGCRCVSCWPGLV